MERLIARRPSVPGRPRSTLRLSRSSVRFLSSSTSGNVDRCVRSARSSSARPARVLGTLISIRIASCVMLVESVPPRDSASAAMDMASRLTVPRTKSSETRDAVPERPSLSAREPVPITTLMLVMPVGRCRPMISLSPFGSVSLVADGIESLDGLPGTGTCAIPRLLRGLA